MNNQPFICKYCGKDTSEIEYDYLSGYDHLACTLETEIKNSEFDCCVVCGEETPYRRTMHVDMRIGYVEGAGQLCRTCYDGGVDRNQIAIPEHIIYNTPNDQELGEKVRRMYYESKNNS